MERTGKEGHSFQVDGVESVWEVASCKFQAMAYKCANISCMFPGFPQILPVTCCLLIDYPWRQSFWLDTGSPGDSSNIYTHVQTAVSLASSRQALAPSHLVYLAVLQFFYDFFWEPGRWKLLLCAFFQMDGASGREGANLCKSP